MQRKVLSILLLGILAMPVARSQENPPPDSVVVFRPGVIGGHEFIPTSFIEDPFVRTFMHTGLGFGSTINRITPPVVVHGQTLGERKADLMFALLMMEYQYAVRPWLAVRGRLDISGRMSTETTTLIAQGVTVLYGFDLGWIFKLAETDRYFFSGSLGLRNISTTDVYVQRFIDGILENGAILPTNRLVETTPSMRASSGLAGAYVLSRLVGITASGTVDYGESLDRSEPDRWYYSLQAAFDINMHSQNGVPVGFVIGGKTGSAPDAQGADDRTAQTIFGRIAYTGAEQFALGLDIGYQFIPIRTLPKKQNFLSATVDMRMYF